MENKDLIDYIPYYLLPKLKCVDIPKDGKTKASESGVLPMLLRPNTNWKEFVVSHGVTHWLYVNDLLPKEGEK